MIENEYGTLIEIISAFSHVTFYEIIKNENQFTVEFDGDTDFACSMKLER